MLYIKFSSLWIENVGFINKISIIIDSRDFVRLNIYFYFSKVFFFPFIILNGRYWFYENFGQSVLWATHWGSSRLTGITEGYCWKTLLCERISLLFFSSSYSFLLVRRKFFKIVLCLRILNFIFKVFCEIWIHATCVIKDRIFHLQKKKSSEMSFNKNSLLSKVYDLRFLNLKHGYISQEKLFDKKYKNLANILWGWLKLQVPKGIISKARHPEFSHPSAKLQMAE